MKKKISYILTLMIITVALTGCGKKKAITVDEYKDIMSSKLFVVNNAKNNIDEKSSIKDIYVAANTKERYQIEFYVLNSVDSAKEFFSNNKTRFGKQVGKNKVETKSKKGNFEKYTVTSLGQYRLVSRIDNTVIYLDIGESNKKKVDEILKELGY